MAMIWEMVYEIVVATVVQVSEYLTYIPTWN